ncbi:Outer membrane protein OmpA [Roseateles sp. YR242]|uniref:OmpA family protein n=1 Tax=Roseateles sp. YR242 TaxID=1855305 RepID=UPI0008B906EF|nr:OmpA family protein [Roseateles sp. YR242]SEK22959.1 Outer membrane protein OmpA [Roseateles sp. YR242]
MPYLHHTKFLILATTTAMLTACGALPERNTWLVQAHSRYDAARADPQVSSLAGNELNAAQAAIARADQAAQDRRGEAEINHLAYLATQRTTLAVDAASGRAADARVSAAAAQRDQTRLAMRTSEADEAQRKLDMARQANERQGTALAAADAQSARDSAALQARDARVRALENEKATLAAAPPVKPTVVTLGDTLFATGKARLGDGGTQQIDKLAALLKRNLSSQAVVEGHTDDVGDPSANQRLSQERANAVVAVLVAQGISRDRLSAHGYGSTRPTASNATAAGRQMNRRVEVTFESSEQPARPDQAGMAR